MPESKQKPIVQKLQGGIIIPYNTKQVTRVDEEGSEDTFFVFNQIKLNQKNKPASSKIREIIIEQLQKELQKSIYYEYDQGSQNTIQGYFSKAQRIDRADIQDECEKILDWIDNSLTYYYQNKTLLINATDEDELILISWDFAQDKPKPSNLLSLSEIKNMF